jgi:hypothetical protein
MDISLVKNLTGQEIFFWNPTYTDILDIHGTNTNIKQN